MGGMSAGSTEGLVGAVVVPMAMSSSLLASQATWEGVGFGRAWFAASTFPLTAQ